MLAEVQHEIRRKVFSSSVYYRITSNTQLVFGNKMPGEVETTIKLNCTSVETQKEN